MKASELMLGDFVRFKCTHPQLTPNIVAIFAIVFDSMVSKKHLVHIVFKDTGLVQYNYDPDVFEGVPFTPEILEKNGWVNLSDEDCKVMQIYSGHDAFWWSSKYGTCGCEGVENKNGEENLVERFACENIWNVHELQHAMRICGIEKEIIL